MREARQPMQSQCTVEEEHFGLLIKVENLLIPERKDKVALRKQQESDQAVYRVLQKAPNFILAMEPS